MIRLVPKAAPIAETTRAAVSGWLSAALARCAASETLADVIASLQDRTRQLWLIEKDGHTTGAVVTEVYETQRGRTCAVPYAGGVEMPATIKVVLDTVEAWARSEGCVRLEVDGRRGWERMLKPHGWEPRLVRMAKELT